MPTQPKRIRVYRYGLLAPTQNAERVRNQLWLAHRYRNKLVEIERRRREEIRAVQGPHATIAPLSVKLAELRDAYADAKAADDKLRMKALRVERKQVFADLRDAREALKNDPVALAAMTAVNDAAHTADVRARAECGVYWGTYQLIEEANDAARTATADPRFVSWNGEGRLGVQIQKGMRIFDLRVNRQLRVMPVEDRSGRNRFAELHLRVGSDGRDPIWAVWPMRVHRPIPATATIKKASVSLWREGTRERWQLHVTVEEPDPAEKTGKAAIAIDLGWRSMGTLRTGQWVDTHGNHGEVTVPARVISGFEKAASLRSIRDGYVNVLRYVMHQWFKTNPPPAEWADQIQYLAQWRSPRRFVRLRRIWAATRYDGDDYGFSLIDAWWHRDRHLYDWEAAQRRKSTGRRNQVYADFAAWVGRTYDHVVIETFDLRTWARKWKGEEKADQHARANRVVAAPGLFRAALERAWCSNGFVLHDMVAAYSTCDCHVCGSRESWDQARELFHRCSKCGVRWDQDVNAAQNLLLRWDAAGGPKREGRERLRVKAGRWARRKTAKAAKATAQAAQAAQ